MPIDLVRIGQILRIEREKQELTVEDVSKALCLRKTLVQALESGGRDFLPHDVYVRGYVKEYANHLKIGEELLPFLTEPVEKVEKAQDLVVKKSKRWVFPARRPPKQYAIYSLAALLLFLLAMYIFPEKPAQYTNSNNTASLVSANAPSNPQDGKPISEISEQKRLMVTCHERAWVSILIDGEEKKEYMLSPREIIVLNAKDRFDILVGNSGGVKLFFNGKDTEFTGQSGQVKRISLS